jgi:alkylhydroperoxidase family enzyme
MGERPTAPRIPPLAQGERDPQVEELLAGVGAGRASNIFTTLVRHPGLFRRWSPFGGKLLRGGKLPARHRELAILRAAWWCRAAYEWAHHVDIGQEAGLSMEEILRVAAGPGADGWDPFEATVLRAVDELHEDACITAATWALLATEYSTEQLIELPMVVGHYTLLAYTLNSLGVQPEEGTTKLPEG